MPVTFCNLWIHYYYFNFGREGRGLACMQTSQCQSCRREGRAWGPYKPPEKKEIKEEDEEKKEDNDDEEEMVETRRDEEDMTWSKE